MNSNILTYLRIKQSNHKPTFQNNHISVQNKNFTVNNIFYGPNQEEVFQNISKNILTKCLQGYNCTVFAYGQTGSGKTYTIQGSEDNPGLVQRTLSFLHNNFDTIKLSFIEIYNENMIDLFDPENEISIREDPINGVTVDNLNVLVSSRLSESLDFYQKGIMNRKTASTQMNKVSSRSHSIFTIQLEIKNKSILKRSKLSFVDLAGSEKIGDNVFDRAKETCNINTSLLCLGKIVHKLSSNDKWHISYRDSKLTFLLKDSLGGNCKLAIIGTVCLEYLPDTINTLNFLKRSKLICNNPSINYDTGGSSIEELTETLKQMDEKNQLLTAEVLELRVGREDAIKSSALYELNRLKANFEILTVEFENICKILKKRSDDNYNSNKELLLEINENLKELNQKQKENIKNIFIKKRKLEQ